MITDNYTPQTLCVDIFKGKLTDDQKCVIPLDTTTASAGAEAACFGTCAENVGYTSAPHHPCYSTTTATQTYDLGGACWTSLDTFFTVCRAPCVKVKDLTREAAYIGSHAGLATCAPMPCPVCHQFPCVCTTAYCLDGGVCVESKGMHTRNMEDTCMCPLDTPPCAAKTTKTTETTGTTGTK
jgi:hypothetical protein